MTDQDDDELPIPFGYKMSWIAVPSCEAIDLAAALGLTDVERCSWKIGWQRAYGFEGVFIAPPIDGWTLAIGSHLEISDEAFLPNLRMLSSRFTTAHYFATHRVVGYQAWAVAEKGKISRAFGYLGERGEFLLDVGLRTAEEVALNTGITEFESAPNEETVLDLAAKWVLDPRKIDQQSQGTGPGWFGLR